MFTMALFQRKYQSVVQKQLNTNSKQCKIYTKKKKQKAKIHGTIV